MDESFLPYAMIEPLMQDGMTFSDLAAVILEQLKLPRERYRLYVDEQPGATLADRIRMNGGVRVITAEQHRELHPMARRSGREPVR